MVEATASEALNVGDESKLTHANVDCLQRDGLRFEFGQMVLRAKPDEISSSSSVLFQALGPYTHTHTKTHMKHTNHSKTVLIKVTNIKYN